MKLWEAMKLMQEGLKVRMCHWGPECFYSKDGDENGNKVIEMPVEDLDEDWEIYQQPKHRCDRSGNLTGQNVLYSCVDDGHGRLVLFSLDASLNRKWIRVDYCPFCGHKSKDVK